MHARIARGFASLLVSTLFGCGEVPEPEPSDASRFSFENAAGVVRYEAIDETGLLVDHRVVDDPMMHEYSRGSWTAERDDDVVVESTATSKNRVHVVFVGDGYTSREMGLYASDVKRTMDLLVKEQPFSSYASYFAFHRIDVVSKESGVTNDPNGTRKNTALGMNYWCSGIDRLLCANVNRVMEEASRAPGVHQVFALADSTRYGGGGYSSPPVSTLAARNSGALELALHEFGHSFGNLADEYDYAGAWVDCPSFANVSRESEADIKSRKTKWWRWLDLPNVGAFKGSCYSETSFYRPTNRSKMRALGNPWEEVNSEQLVVQIYRKVKPIEAVQPAAGRYRGHRVIEVTPMRPSRHALDVSWTVDGKPVNDLKGLERVDTASMGLGKGSHTIEAIVVDNTSRVRDPSLRSKYMTQSVKWTIDVE